jgi:hypothetical protein
MFISRSIPLYYQLVQAGETADLFHSFAPVGDELICAFRRHRIVDYAEWGSGENYYESRIMTQRFDISTGTPLSAPEEAMAMGEDPRCVSVQGRPFILGANPIGGNFNYVLFDVHARKSLNIEVTNRADFKYGKNWQPFVAGEKLYGCTGFRRFVFCKSMWTPARPKWFSSAAWASMSFPRTMVTRNIAVAAMR